MEKSRSRSHSTISRWAAPATAPKTTTPSLLETLPHHRQPQAIVPRVAEGGARTTALRDKSLSPTRGRSGSRGASITRGSGAGGASLPTRMQRPARTRPGGPATRQGGGDGAYRTRPGNASRRRSRERQGIDFNAAAGSFASSAKSPSGVSRMLEASPELGASPRNMALAMAGTNHGQSPGRNPPRISQEEMYMIPTPGEQRMYFAWERHVAAEVAARKREDERSKKIMELLRNLDLHGKSVRGEIPWETLEEQYAFAEGAGSAQTDGDDRDATASLLPGVGSPICSDQQLSTPSDAKSSLDSTKKQAKEGSGGSSPDSSKKATSPLGERAMGLQEKQEVRARLLSDLAALEVESSCSGARGPSGGDSSKVKKDEQQENKMEHEDSTKKSASIEVGMDEQGEATFAEEMKISGEQEIRIAKDEASDNIKSVAAASKISAGELSEVSQEADEPSSTEKAIPLDNDKKPAKSPSSSIAADAPSGTEAEDVAKTDASVVNNEGVAPTFMGCEMDAAMKEKTVNSLVEEARNRVRSRIKAASEKSSSPEQEVDSQGGENGTGAEEAGDGENDAERAHEIPLYCRFLQPADQIYMQSSAFDPDAVPSTSLMKLLNQSGTWYHEDPFEKPPVDTRCLCRELDESFIWVESDPASSGEDEEAMEEEQARMEEEYYRQQVLAHAQQQGQVRRAISF
eukprot:GSA25T00007614001.1